MGFINKNVCKQHYEDFIHILKYPVTASPNLHTYVNKNFHSCILYVKYVNIL